MNILVSRCLLGEPCRYDGQGVPVPALERLREEGHTLIPVCPEILGGLPTPRSPAEVQPDGRVVSKDGQDVTAAYLEGGKLALEIAKEHNCTLAVLKARSPSCGSVQIYDGSFTGVLIPGQGVTACLLMEAGIAVMDETQLSDDKNPSKQVRR